MQIIVAFAVVAFFLGVGFGLPYQQARRRRLALALAEQEEINRVEAKKRRPALDKSLFCD